MGVMHVRRLTTQEWADRNPILAKNQMALDETTGDFRIGDGLTRWSKLDNYTLSSNSTGGGGSTGGEVSEELLDRIASLESDTMMVVSHGDDPDFPRPVGVKVVYWLGSVEPLNAIDDDLLSEEVDAL